MKSLWQVFSQMYGGGGDGGGRLGGGGEGDGGGGLGGGGGGGGGGGVQWTHALPFPTLLGHAEGQRIGSTTRQYQSVSHGNLCWLHPHSFETSSPPERHPVLVSEHSQSVGVIGGAGGDGGGKFPASVASIQAW